MSELLFTDNELEPSPDCPRMEKVRRLCTRATLRALRDLVKSPLWPLIIGATEEAGHENPSRFAHPIASEVLLGTKPSDWDTLTRTDVRQKILEESFSELSYLQN